MRTPQRCNSPLQAWLLGLLALLALGYAGSSAAMHENDHRFTIWGQVKDAAGQPVAGAQVRITGLGGQPLGEALADAEGRYSVTLHVHTPERGKPFWVSVGRTVAKGSFEFDEGDRTTERRSQVDLELPRQG